MAACGGGHVVGGARLAPAVDELPGAAGEALSLIHISSDAEEVDFADSGDISGYAVETIAKAQDLGILYGYEDNTIRPKNTLSRAEGVALLMNLVECLEAA